MLIQFKFSNFGPFAEEAILDMRAVKSYKEHPDNCIEIDKKYNLLKVALIYGANASGKTNFVYAYECFSSFVRQSMNSNNEETNKTIISDHYEPFLFSEDSKKADTEFEASYYIDGVELIYGYTYNSNRVTHEWLYKIVSSTGRKSTIFERDSQSIRLGSSVQRSCEKYVEQIDDSVLVLTFFNRLKLRTDIFDQTYDCVMSYLAFETTYGHYKSFLYNTYFSYDFDDKEKKSLLSFLSSINTGIIDITVKKTKDNIEVFTHHIGVGGKKYKTSFEIESHGTMKAIMLYSLVKVAIREGKGLIIDELNAQLHPLLLKYIVDMFYSSNSQGHLIYTTHDTVFLEKKYLRRDQVWFIEKDKNGKASLYSLSDFKIRPDSSFSKSYLGGAYGGIPILKDFDFDTE